MQTNLWLIDNILLKICPDSKKEVYEKKDDICDYITDLIFDDKNLLISTLENEYVMNKFKEIFSIDLNNDENISSENNEDIYYQCLILIGNLVKKSIEEDIPYPQSKDMKIDPEYANHIFSFIPLIIRNFQERKKKVNIPSVDGKEIIPIGKINIQIILTVIDFFNYFKEIPLRFDEVIMKNGFILRAVDFFFKYDNNDIYLQNFIAFIKLYLKNSFKRMEMNNYLFNEICLQKKILERLDNLRKYKFNRTGTQIDDRLYPHLVNLFYKINFYSGVKSKIDEQRRTRLGSFNFVAKGDLPGTLFAIQNETEDFPMESQSIKRFLNEEWEEVYKTKIKQEIYLYEQRLGEEENFSEEEEPDENEDLTDGGKFVFWTLKKEKDDKEKEKKKEEGEFEFVGKEGDNKEIDVMKVKVDELGDDIFNDFNYWKSNNFLNMKDLEGALKDIEDNK